MGKSRKPLKFKKIKPLVEKCKDCKKGRVTSHHLLCDKCWGKRAKEKNKKERRKLLQFQKPR